MAGPPGPALSSSSRQANELPTRSTTLFTALQRTASEHGDDRGIRYFATLETEEYRGYAELERNARAIAQALVAAGHVPGERAVIAMTSGLLWIDALYGILAAGLSVVPTASGGFDAGTAIADRVATIARASEASIVLVDRKMLANLGVEAHLLGAPALVVEDLLADGDADAWTAPDVDGDAMACMLFTSGSTGEPKGVVGTHATLLAAAHATNELVFVGPDPVLVGWLPLHHAMGLMMQVLAPTTLGAQVVLTATEQFQRRPMSWLQLISDHRATVSLAGNFAFALCVKFSTDAQVADLDLSSIRCFVSGSEPVRPETVAAFVERFAPSGLDPNSIAPAFGTTEAMLVSAKPDGVPYRLLSVDPASLELGRVVPAEGASIELISCGTPASGTTLAIVDPDSLAALPEGRIGELWISAPGLSPGYFRRPDATAEAFGFTLPGDDRSYMRTGDLGTLVDGELFITGRLKDVIILRGRNIYPQDLEAAAAALSPALGIGAAFELERRSAFVGVIVEFDAQEAGAEAEDPDALLRRVSRDLLDRFSLPSVAVGLVPLGAVPRTPTGKVRRKPARAMLDSQELTMLNSIGCDDAA
jgi:acyl-CoA synthetase (AMP-forming)/AMP-acid ligase II